MLTPQAVNGAIHPSLYVPAMTLLDRDVANRMLEKVTDFEESSDTTICDLCRSVGVFKGEGHKTKMNEEDQEELPIDLTKVSGVELVRMELRYLRRDISGLKKDLKDGLDTLGSTKAAKENQDDHEARIRKLENRVVWSTGFGAALGVILGLLIPIVGRMFKP